MPSSGREHVDRDSRQRAHPAYDGAVSSDENLEPDAPPPPPPPVVPETELFPEPASPRAPVPVRSGSPVWTHFLTPLAVVIGAVVVAGMIWYTDDDPVQPVNIVSPDLNAVSAAPTAGAVSPTSVLDAFLSYASQIDIDTSAFRNCLAADSAAQTVNAGLSEGNSYGVNGTPTFFVNNKKIVGAQPTEIFLEVIQAELDGSPTSIDQYSPSVQALAESSPPRFEIVDTPPSLAGANIEGNPDADVVLAEFSDFQCPFCQRWTLQSLPTIKAELGDQIELAFIHFPITAIHPNAGYASVAAICAGQQDAFWEMHDLLFARQEEWASLPVQ